MHVLIVDDNLLSCTRLIEQARAAGWSTRAVGGVHATEAARARRPDVIVMNLLCTTCDPSGLIRAFKAAPEFSTIPILGFCGHRESGAWRSGMAAGCDRVVANSSIAGNLATLLHDLIPASPQHE